MKFVEYGKEDEKIVSIKINITDEDVTINAINPEGAFMSHLLTITDKGIKRHKYVHPDLGFDLDEEGRLKVL